MITAGARFWDKVRRSGADDCWEWQAGVDDSGYGSFSWGHQETRKAHHVAFYLTNGRWPKKGLVICHTCDNPPCCNPRHLFEDTTGVNTLDARLKGRLNVPHPSMAGEANPKAKLNWDIVRKIRATPKVPGRTEALSEIYQIHRATINRILANQIWVESPLDGGAKDRPAEDAKQDEVQERAASPDGPGGTILVAAEDKGEDPKDPKQEG